MRDVSCRRACDQAPFCSTFDESSGACGCRSNGLIVVLQCSLPGGAVTTATPLTHLDTSRSLLAVGTGTGTLLHAVGL